MLRIIKSLFVVVAVAALSAGATGAYFSDTATITDNTFTAGILEIRVNGQDPVVGSTFGPAAPGDIFNSPTYSVNNYGAPWFAGPSNLTAKKLLLTANMTAGDAALYNSLLVKVEVNRGWPAWQVSYEGPLSGLSNVDLLPPNWTELIPGSSQDFRYTVWLPETNTDQSALMGMAATWNFVFEGRTN